jgi:5-(carboxyamino)imidazole ribonucleotide synthase
MHRSETAQRPRERVEPPPPRIGILGGGQLAKMTASAASQFGCEVVVLERQDDFPAHSVDTHALIGDWDDPKWLLELGAKVDVVTLENEFVNVQSLAVLGGNGHRLWPSVGTIALVQDKLRQKEAFARAGLPLLRYAEASTPRSVGEFGLPAVLKKRQNGYDGKGNFTVRTTSDLAAAWLHLDASRNPLYVEEFCNFVMELAVIVTRGQDGKVVTYPVVETVNREHICHVVKAPAAIPASLAVEATDIAVRAVEAVGGVGSFGMELFRLPDDRLVVNEIAPRVHNTGHYTIEACVCSQFENHVRAVLGWPLGPPDMLAPAAAMVNLLGYGPGSGEPRGLRDAMAVPGAHVHVYGKKNSARGRKMGHVTALGRSVEGAVLQAQLAADCIQFGERK